ncbi:SET and MYND domain-containing protein 4 [Caerostris extrusa]|uniref:Protein-lysine N-methyltransferase SMYD4 n=1 Tax=Caerostris extrusa TaxID=172846 RepID=A0AAV4Q4U9_CAEEX|nr:SET and MYND domain-containing protein 4 [Caerostris extrusa]
MAAYTCWQDVLDDITNRLKKTKTLTRFSKLKSNEDRIEYCLRDDIIRSKVQQWLNIIVFLLHISKSEDAGSHVEELSLGFGNRSAALFHLLKNEECLKDIDKAVEYDYPRDLRFKLLQRKGQCWMKLNQPALALEALKESLKLLEEARLDSRRIARQQKEIEAIIKTVEEMEQSKEDDTNEENTILPLSYGPHSSVDAASAAVDIKFEKSKGRYIVGKQSIIGSCHQCSQVRYCSQQCVDESWEKYHKWECGNLDSLHSVGIAHLSFRVILVTGLSFIQENREELVKSSNFVYPFDFPDGKYQATTFFSTALLLLMLLDRLNYFATLESQSLRERLISCNLNSRVGSAPSTPTHKSRSPVHSRLSVNSVEETDMPTGPASMEIFVGGLLLRHILQLICNANAITELQTAPQANSNSSVLNQRQVKVATGIFPSASLMNHSCNPSVISSFCKNVLIVRAICDVESGQEIFNCYGPHFRRMPREDRQRSLLEQYFLFVNVKLVSMKMKENKDIKP